MSDELKPGDIVMLKSGGPRMTIDSVSQWDEDDENKEYTAEENGWYCAWFDTTNRFRTASFNPRDLVKVPGPVDF
jgi:uncharacterized protein YodC (DUF2158 family)